MKHKPGFLKNVELLLILIIWIMIFASPLIIFQRNDQIFWFGVEIAWLGLLPFLVLFLISHFVLIPVFLFRNKHVLFFVSVILLLAAFSATTFLAERANHRNNPKPPDPWHQVMPPDQMRPAPPPVRMPQQRGSPIPFPPFVNTIIISMLVVGFDTGLRLIFRWSNLQQEKTMLEKENVKSQLAFLRTQISPHFFMNTLNNIHSQMDINTEDAKDSIIKLSKLMRHLLYDSQEEKTSLSKEVEFIRSYINLMKLRYSDKVDIKIEIPEKLPEKQIPPLLFTSLIENAFKHGISYSNDSFIHLKMELADERLVFNLANSKTPKKNIDTQKGIGLENTRKRLDLLYADKYSLDIIDNENSFNVKLEIPL